MNGLGFRLLARACVVVGAALLLSACGSSSAVGPRASGGGNYRHQPGQPTYKVGAPYQINGIWYYPKVDYYYDESGVASWYGEAFDQQATANGEIFDLNQLTAAHKTLPLPSIVEVTNLQNGRAMRLRVNDRGPFAQERIIDVSRRAAQLLGFERAGTANVRVRILKDESIQVAEAAKRGNTGNVMLAAAPSTVAVASVAPAPRRSEPAPAPAPVVERSIASTPLPPAAPASPTPEPQQNTVVAAASPPPVTSAPAQNSPRKYWPSLIASAHAESYNPPPAVKTLRAEPEQAVAGRGAGRIFVQAGAFAVPENAQRARERLASLGNVQVLSTSGRGTTLYRVRLGPVGTVAEADRLISRLANTGLTDARVVME